MNVGDYVLYGIAWTLMMVSWKVAEQHRALPAIILGVLAWCALFLPRMLIWPNPEQKNTEWWWLVAGALAFIGGPLLILVRSKGKKK